VFVVHADSLERPTRVQKKRKNIDMVRDIILNAHATFLNDTQISLVQNGSPITLSEGECIEFKRYAYSDEPVTEENLWVVAKILGFGGTVGKYANRIFFLPWNAKEETWEKYKRPPMAIGLEDPYVGGMEGDWRTIRKLSTCPVPIRPENRARKANMLRELETTPSYGSFPGGIQYQNAEKRWANRQPRATRKRKGRKGARKHTRRAQL